MFDFTTAGIAICMIVGGLFGSMVFKPAVIAVIAGIIILASTLA